MGFFDSFRRRIKLPQVWTELMAKNGDKIVLVHGCISPEKVKEEIKPYLEILDSLRD